MTFKLTAIVLATALGAVAAYDQTTVVTTDQPAAVVAPETSTTVTTKERALGADTAVTKTDCP